MGIYKIFITVGEQAWWWYDVFILQHNGYSLWADKVQQRCTTLLSHMHHASNELYPTVVVGKDSIEERRAKDPNDGLHVAVAKP